MRLLIAIPLILAPLAVQAETGFYYRNVNPGPASPRSTSPSPGTTAPAPGTTTEPVAPFSYKLSPVSGAAVGDAAAGTSAATGGTKPYGFSLKSGNLPTGLRIGADGSLQGTYGYAGLFSGTVLATDAAGAQSEASFTIDVRPTAPSLAFSQPTGLVAGIPFSAQAQDLSGNSIAWSLAAQPAWLTVGNATGVVSGVPSGTSLSFTLQGTDPFSRSASLALGPYAIAAPYATMAAIPARIRSGASVTAVLDSNLTPGTWGIATSPSSAGLTSSGTALTGNVPTSATEKSFTVTATRTSTVPGATATAQATRAFTVVPPLTVQAPASLTVPSGSNLAGFTTAPTSSFALSASQLAWRLAASSAPLPANVTVDPATGRLAGTLQPYYADTAFPGIKLTATDTDGTTADTATGYTLTVTAAIPTKTFSTTNRASSVVLSNNNLTATGTAVGHFKALANVTMGATDKRYFEVVSYRSSGNVHVGVSGLNQYNTYLGANNSFSIGVGATDGTVYGVTGQKLSGFPDGTVVMVAVDMAANQIWFGFNGTWNGTPGTATGAFSYPFSVPSSPAVSVYKPGSATIQIENLSYAPPAGFSAFP